MICKMLMIKLLSPPSHSISNLSRVLNRCLPGIKHSVLNHKWSSDAGTHPWPWIPPNQFLVWVQGVYSRVLEKAYVLDRNPFLF